MQRAGTGFMTQSGTFSMIAGCLKRLSLSAVTVGKYRIPHNRAFSCDGHAIFNFPWMGKRENYFARICWCAFCLLMTPAGKNSILTKKLSLRGRIYASTTTRHALARELWEKAGRRKRKGL